MMITRIVIVIIKTVIAIIVSIIYLLFIYSLYIYIFFEVVIVIMCDYFPKLLKTHFFILQIFCSHFGSHIYILGTWYLQGTILMEIRLSHSCF